MMRKQQTQNLVLTLRVQSFHRNQPQARSNSTDTSKLLHQTTFLFLCTQPVTVHNYVTQKH